MLCPVCLSFLLNREAVSQVNGTLYCAHHAVETVLQSTRDRPHLPTQQRFQVYTPPPDPTA